MLYQTHVQVHLQNIKANLLGIKKAVGPGCKVLIAVKANAYGHGAIEVSRMAEKIGIDWLAVATVPEAIELREAGIKLPILKLTQAFPEEMEEAVKHDVTLVVYELENAKFLNETAKRLGRVAKAHLNIDTGMGRVGVYPEEAPKRVGDIIKECLNVKFSGVLTHLPASDEASQTYTKRQIALFKKTVEEIEKTNNFKFELVSCANSAAVLAYPEAYFNMVRPGIMIYGYYPSSDTPQTIPLLPGLSFKTRVMHVKKVAAGVSIGYGRTWIAPEETHIATIPVGYADGFNRLFSNAGRVLINGKYYPIVGRVCMDASMCNLGKETDVKVGDEVVLIGKQGGGEITAYEWADKLNTITYEVTSQINKRVRRYYDPY